MNKKIIEIQDRVVDMLKTVYDPEIPVNIYDLGLIYNVEVDDNMVIAIEMTLTSPSCPASDFILGDVHYKLKSIPEVQDVNIELVFDPPWDKDMMSEEAKLELGFL